MTDIATARRARHVVSALTAGLIVLGLLAAGPSPAGSTAGPAGPPSAGQVSAPLPTLDWTLCPDIPRALCATAEVPLDYDDPTGTTILLDVVKLPALVTSQRLGTLFVNPGGPGGSAREFAPYAAELLGDTVATRYDVVGIDPRGVGPSSQMVCRTSASFPSFRYPFPITEPQSKSVWKDGRWFNRACKQGPNEIVAHMSTADTARDMDLIRQAVGDPLLNYYGISYGTYLGAVYAAMFPDYVGRFVVDGVLDPVNWATGDGTNGNLPFTTRINSARGAYEALTSALTECDRVGKRKCGFAGHAQQKWRRLIFRAKSNKLTFFGDKFSYQLLVGFTLSSLYDNYDYSFLGYFLQEVYRDNFAGKRPSARLRSLSLRDMRQRVDDVMRAPYGLARTVNAGDPFLGVACADSQNPSGRLAWWNAGRAQDRAEPWFGSLWTWASAACSGWAKVNQQDAFFGPFDVTPANPILVVGNSFDPATPVQGARRFTTLFEGSRFLLMDGWGHGAIGNTCVTAAFDAYYATGRLPREGTVCDKDRPLFGGGGFFRPVESWRPQAS
jgi:pimeloyl-ACP methyl ester carboxylesterase